MASTRPQNPRSKSVLVSRPSDRKQKERKGGEEEVQNPHDYKLCLVSFSVHLPDKKRRRPCHCCLIPVCSRQRLAWHKGSQGGMEGRTEVGKGDEGGSGASCGRYEVSRH